MGYDLKLYVGELRNGVNEKNSLDVVAMVDLCGVDTLVSSLINNTGLPVYFYDTDGNTRVEFDRYDRELSALPIDQVIKIIQKTNRNNPYRRYKVALGILKTIKTTFQNPHVVLFGH